MTAEEQIKAIGKTVTRLNRRKDAVYAELMEHLEGYGVRLVNFQKLGSRESNELERYFDTEIAPLTSPTTVSRRQPFPFLQNKEIYAVGVLAGKSGQEKLGIIPCGTGVIPRLIGVPGQSGAYMLSEDLILHFLPKVFSGYRVVSKSLIRVTRNADIDADALYDEDLDYREFMAKLIKRRRRLAPVRLELSRELDGDIVKTLCAYTDVKQDAVFRCRSPLDLSFLFQIQDILRQRTELFFEKRFPQRSAQFRPGCPVIPQIREGDKLLSYPYESMKPFLDFLQEAASDPNVVSIKMTLYRVARHSKIIESLIEAAENGKSVLALVELKARFDEENNIEWSRRLEEAGCQVIYGLDGFKVHSKLCLVTRRENGKTEYFTQIGTGNYTEAECGYYGAITDVQVDDGLFVDIGGASAELALFAEGKLQRAGCIPVGSLKLYRDCVKKIMPGKESRQRIEKAIRKAFESSDLKDIPKETQIVGVGGTIRATLRLCKKLCGLPEDSRTFNREQLHALTRCLCKNDKDAMDLILLYEPERIHTLVPGVLLLLYLMDQYGAQTVTVSHYGVREGYLHQKIQPALPDNS